MWVLTMLLVLLLFPAMGWSANTHGTPDQTKEMQAWFGDAMAGYVVSGCLPGTSGSTTTGTFACNAYVKPSTGELVYVTQATKTVGPLNGGNGTYWIAVHRDTSTAVGGWTRQAGTHYLWQKSATQPATPASGLIVASATVAASVVSATAPIAFKAPEGARLRTVYVAEHATGGEGTSGNPWTGWETGVKWTTNTTYLFAGGTYSYSTPPAWGKSFTQYVAMGEVVLKHTGTGIAVDFDACGAAAISPAAWGIRVSSGFKVQGNANTTDGVFARCVSHSHFGSIRVMDVSAACFHLQFALINQWDSPRCSVNEESMSIIPARGMYIDTHPAGGGPSNANTIIDPIIEGVSSDGIKIVASNGNRIVGGVSEGNGYGFVIDSNSGWNSIDGLWMESNTFSDLTVNGFHNRATNVYGTKTTQTASGAYGNVFSNSVFTAGSNGFVFASGSFGNTLRDSTVYAAVSDSGTGNQKLNIYSNPSSLHLTDYVTRNDNGAGTPWVEYISSVDNAYGFQIGYNSLLGPGNTKRFFLDGKRTGGSTTVMTLQPSGGGLEIGTPGSGTITRHITATTSMDFAAWAGNDCQDFQMDVTGSADGDTVVLGIPVALAGTAGVVWSAWVFTANVVNVRGCKITAGASANPAAATVRVDVWKH